LNLNIYHWVKFESVKIKEFDTNENREVISNFHAFEGLKQLQNWLCLYDIKETINKDIL
jgi:hypothetical protein